MPRRLPLLAVLAVLAAGCGAASSAASCDPLPGVRSGLCPIPVEDRRPAPDDDAPVLAAGVGDALEAGDPVDRLSVSDFAGRVLVVNFWASWCGPCRVEQPELNEAAAALPDDEVAFLGVNIEDTEANALAHVREFDIPYPHLYDPRNIYASQYRGIGPRTIPSTIILDREGRVAVRIFGVVGADELVVLASVVANEA